MRKVCAGIAAGFTATAVAAGVALASPVAPPVVAAPAATHTVQAVTTHARSAPPSYTLVIGDSIAHRSRDQLKARHPHWIVDAVEGRNVDRLMPLVRGWVERKGRAPAQLVVELGTNWSTTWEAADYERVRALLPHAQVEFVTPFRSPTAKHPRSTGRYAFDRTGQYAAAMRRLAAAGEGVCVAEWRDWAQAHTDQLVDGVHPARSAKVVWADLVSSAMRGCRSEVG
ncbi:hypothetical protein [Nocardioides jiangxiensis]|uniref:SGNH hydrolase-type esterase domain-containing protein n=1 Tax=Nocardioides jiangxiensis TaxID=3064524 RepID=A0ABT9B1B5_9ACTN|nr:hypothetical protein [Nocardioides sp. WY-20]MDO7868641.1 hypothetical protein [Nocardioides sp. WY-20]